MLKVDTYRINYLTRYSIVIIIYIVIRYELTRLILHHKIKHLIGGISSMVMQRIDPFREFRKLDEVLSRVWQGNGDGHFERRWAIPIDLAQDGDNVVLRATVPGVDPDAIDVTIEDGVLTISAETVSEGDGSYIVRERRAGKLYRALRLPNTLDVGKAESEYRHGVLTLIFPKVEAVKARRLEIKQI